MKKKKDKHTPVSWRWPLAFLLIPLLVQWLLRGSLPIRLIDHVLFLPLLVYLYTLHAFLLPKVWAPSLFLLFLMLPDYGVSAFIFVSGFILLVAMLFMLLPPLFAIPAAISGKSPEKIQAMADYFRVGLLLAGACAGIVVCSVLPHVIIGGHPVPPSGSQFKEIEPGVVDGETVSFRHGRREGEADLFPHYNLEFNRFCYRNVSWTRYADGFTGRVETVLPFPWRRYFAVAVQHAAGGNDITWAETDTLPPSGRLFPGDPIAADTPSIPVLYRQSVGLYGGQYNARDLNLLSSEMASDSGLKAEFAFVCNSISDAMIQIHSQPVDPKVDMDHHVFLYEDIYRNQYPDYVNMGKAWRKIDSAPAYQLVGKASMNEKPYSLHTALTIKAGKLIVVLGVCPAEADSRFLPVFNHLVDGISLK